MQIPNSFEYMGLTWTVNYGDVLETIDKYARTHFKLQRIEIDETLPHQLKEQTFLHELLHVIIWGSGLDPAIEALRSRQTEESVVNGLANGLYGLLREIQWIK